MKKFSKSGPTRLRRVIGNLHIQRRILPTLAVAAGILTASNAFGTEINLVTGTTINGVAATTSGSFATGTSAGGQNTIYELIDTIPAGTGVFLPFLSYQHRGTEEGINTSQLGNGQGVLDDKRVPQWTHDLHLSDLLPVNGYYLFELDANETGSGQPNRLLSIDDIRIYTSATSPFVGAGGSIGNDSQAHTAINNDSVGTLRYAQNEPNGTANFVLIDASRRTEGSTSGSGSSDMLVRVPVTLFAGAGANDFVTFYTLNGAHDAAGDDGSDAGYEEWRALTGPTAVPDGGSTLLLLGSALIPLGLLRARRESNKA
jgi:hypothetical protein